MLVVELFLEAVFVPLFESNTRARCEPLVGGGSGLPPLRLSFLTSTQSGSGLGVNGLLGRLGLGMCPSEGG